MVANPAQTVMTVEEYLAQEEVGEVKHEYVNGQVYAMSGGTLDHDTIANNVRAALRDYLRGGSCRVFGPDVRLRVSPTIYYYPDGIVVCDDDTLRGTDVEVARPRLIAEVLSDSTEAKDRGSKFRDYQTLTGFEEYLLVDSQSRSVERFRRTERGLWLYQHHDPEATVTLESIGLTIATPLLYELTFL